MKLRRRLLKGDPGLCAFAQSHASINGAKTMLTQAQMNQQLEGEEEDEQGNGYSRELSVTKQES